MASCKAETIPGLPSVSNTQVQVDSSGLPLGFPQSVNSKLAWTGADFTNPEEYILHLSPQDIEEVEAALVFFKSLEKDGDEISKENFPLATLGPRFDQMRHEIHNGKGFGLIRGLDAEHYSVEDRTMIYLGIQSYIANQTGRQDGKGNMIVHIIADNSSEMAQQHHRHSTSSITFHNEEAGDVVSWLTKSTAASGGRCILASAYTVYNILATHRPELVRALAGGDWPFALPKFHCRPILFCHKGRIIMNFGRTPLLGSAAHPRPSHLPALSPRQLEALNAIESIAKATQVEIVTKAGDIHFINNLAVLHRREGFVNGDDLLQRRHLLRMRLRDEELGWDIPEQLQSEWYKAFEDAMADKVWHLQPMPEGYFPLRKMAN